MRDFHVVLPTYAPDYSGACSVLYELGGAVVVHDPSGCTGNFVAYDEPRGYEGGSRVFTSGLDDMQALLGNDDALIEATCQAHAIVGGEFVAIIGTPNPMILGTDYQAIAREVRRRCGVPALAIDTSGTAYYDEGASKALLAVLREVVAPEDAIAGGSHASSTGEGSRQSVTLLGATPLDLTSQFHVKVARDLLENAGWRVAACWSMGSDLDELRHGLRVACNVVLSSSALPLARELLRRFGTPYVWGMLAGEHAVDAFIAHLARVADGTARAPLPPDDAFAPAVSRGRALVVAEPVMATAMRRALEMDCGLSAEVATLFPFGAKQAAQDDWGARPSDRGVVDEDDLSRLVCSGDYDLVVGDGLLDGFALPGQGGPAFARIPHVAVSSRISWSDPACPFGAGFLRCVEEAR